MITEEQILAAEGEELSKLLDGIFSGPFEHDTENKGTHHVKCKRCGEVIPLMERWDSKEMYPCWSSPFDDLIPLNWDNAMSWRDWVVKEYGHGKFLSALFTIYKGTVFPIAFKQWIATVTMPKHYLQAAAICKINAEKGTK